MSGVRALVESVAILALWAVLAVVALAGCEDGAEGEAEAEAEAEYEDAGYTPDAESAVDTCTGYWRLECECVYCNRTGCYADKYCQWQDGECACTVTRWAPIPACYVGACEGE